ncbi:MAG: GHKL domain-containing protein [Gammaproteobacteria bacterium]|nr:GHKL domain-containing protein [Gammaproteobacteria bacterium]
MEAIRIKSNSAKKIIFLLIILSISSLLALMFAADNPNEFNRMQLPLLVINGLSLLVLFGVVTLSVKKILMDYKKSKLGARLRARMALAFSGLSVLPVLLVFIFATDFMNKGLDIWFDADVEGGLRNALLLGRSAMDDQEQKRVFDTANIALSLNGIEDIDQQLNRSREAISAKQLLLLDQNLQVIAFSTETIGLFAPQLPSLVEINIAQTQQSWSSLDSSSSDGYTIRVLIPILNFASNQTPLYLQGIYAVDPRLSMMADSVEETYARYGRMSFLKIPIQYSYILTLLLVVMLALLLAIYGAIEFADRLVRPIEALEKKTRSTSESNLMFNLPRSDSDEISALVESFIKAEKEAAWSDVARRMAHEINNPLTPIQLSAERIKKRYASAFKEEDLDFLNKSTDTIVNQVEVLRDMVSAFGNFAKQPQLSFEVLDLSQLIDESLDFLSRDNDLYEVVVEHKGDASIEADIKRIRQVLNNVFTNTIDALQKENNPVITVKTEPVIHQSNAYVVMEVKDNGHGFDSDLLDSAFEPYTTTKNKGTGLGLPIVKKIIEEHKGLISIKNNKEKGATLKIFFLKKQ